MRLASGAPPVVGAVLTVVKAAALTFLFIIPVLDAGTRPADQQSLAERYHAALQRQLAAHHCSTGPLPGRGAPVSALVRTPAGRLRQISYRVGLQMHRGVRKGTLVAVCADAVDRRPSD